jgi:hypothetical protein
VLFLGCLLVFKFQFSLVRCLSVSMAHPPSTPSPFSVSCMWEKGYSRPSSVVSQSYREWVGVGVRGQATTRLKGLHAHDVETVGLDLIWFDLVVIGEGGSPMFGRSVGT